MNYRYHNNRSGSPRVASLASRFLLVIGVCAAVGVFFGVVWLFRKHADPEVQMTAVADDTAATTFVLPTDDVEIALAAMEGETVNGTARRIRTPEAFSLTMVADLPVIDPATATYEVWFVKPGIVDFFSLGEMFYREDGKWGFAWTATAAEVRTDINEFDRVMIIREPRDGNAEPSSDQVAQASFGL